jgi:hypothetical protein
MLCRTVRGARETDVRMLGNVLHALGVHGACATRSERGLRRAYGRRGRLAMVGQRGRCSGSALAQLQQLAFCQSLATNGALPVGVGVREGER